MDTPAFLGGIARLDASRSRGGGGSDKENEETFKTDSSCSTTQAQSTQASGRINLSGSAMPAAAERPSSAGRELAGQLSSAAGELVRRVKGAVQGDGGYRGAPTSSPPMPQRLVPAPRDPPIRCGAAVLHPEVC